MTISELVERITELQREAAAIGLEMTDVHVLGVSRADFDALKPERVTEHLRSTPYRGRREFWCGKIGPRYGDGVVLHTNEPPEDFEASAQRVTEVA